VFLELNGSELTASPEEATVVILELAAGSVAEETLAAWIAEHMA
jgi:prophage maintenance system killer protein